MNRAKIRTVHWVPILVGAALVLLVAAATSAGPPVSCAALAQRTIRESADFTPAEQRRTNPVQRPLGESAMSRVADGAADGLVPDSELGGLRLQLALVNGDALYRYFLDEPVLTMTPEQFWAAGGIQLEKDPAEGGDFAAYLLQELGERAVPVDIGPYRAALTWADPTSSGVRTHNLYWSDGEDNYALIAVRSPEEIVNLARDMVCR